jgi:CHAT domain-containing protein/Tfp pilus assembly protein PilF
MPLPRLLIIVAAVLAGTLAAAPVFAQNSIEAIEKRYKTFEAAGNRAGALAEAQKLEAAVKARSGPQSAEYARALFLLGNALRELDRHAEAEPHYRNSVAILEKALGPTHPNVATALNNLAIVYEQLGRYRDTEQTLRKALAITEKSLGPSHSQLAPKLNNLAVINWRLARYGEAEALFKRALAIYERDEGSEAQVVVETLSNLAAVYRGQRRYNEAGELFARVLAVAEKTGSKNLMASTLHNLAVLREAEGRYREAEQLYGRALPIVIGVQGAEHPNVALLINNVGIVYEKQGRTAEAERAYQRALAILEKARGPSHPSVADTLNNLAGVYRVGERYEEAEGLLKRALAIREQALGPKHPEIAESLNNIANLYAAQKRHKEAEDLYRRVVAIREQNLGVNHVAVGRALNNLAIEYRSQGRYVDAARLYERTLKIFEGSIGKSHPDMIPPLTNYGVALLAAGHPDEATPALTRALALAEEHLGPNHRQTLLILDNLATASANEEDAAKALDLSRNATNRLLDDPTEGTDARLTEEKANLFRRRAEHLWQASEKHLEPNAALATEAFTMAQWANQSAAAAALQQMGARFSAGSDKLATLVRETQDLNALWRDKDKALASELSKPEAGDNAAKLAALRDEMARITEKLTAAKARLAQEFPDFAVLASPRPLGPNDARGLLAGSEALVTFLVGEDSSFVFALTREGLDWQRIPLGADKLAVKVAAFRKGLTIEEATAAKPQLFDLSLAHELYGTLLAPVEASIKGKTNLAVVPAGPLTALPFHLLLTDKPPSTPTEKDFAAYRAAPWLLKRHAVSVLPSVASLKALRVSLKADRGGKPLVGFGDPIFAPQGGQAARGVRNATRAYADFWRGAGVDRAKLAQALPELPDTADELKAIAAKVGAGAADVHLKREASEATLKQLPLADYRIVYFATHGLVAGDIKGVAEPSLALTLPETPSPVDDGLLTASEVAQLKLNADWVVLSACNTAAGDKPGAEALSGLARSFFYAGARALLVSHWAVASASATRLTTAAFAAMAADPKIGRAEALRRAMIDHMDDMSGPYSPHPAFWGPFMVVGEGST